MAISQQYPIQTQRIRRHLLWHLIWQRRLTLTLFTNEADPDADRLGVYAKDTKTGEYKVFTGNMSGMLICEYEMSPEEGTWHSARKRCTC